MCCFFSSIIIFVIYGRTREHTTKKSRTLFSSLPHLVIHLVIRPSHKGKVFTTVKLGFLAKNSANNFQFRFCSLGSPGTIWGPAHKFPSKCSKNPEPASHAVITSSSIYFQKSYFFSILQFSCGP